MEWGGGGERTCCFTPRSLGKPLCGAGLPGDTCRNRHYARDCWSPLGASGSPCVKMGAGGQNDATYLPGGLGLTEVTCKNSQQDAFAHNNLEL